MKHISKHIENIIFDLGVVLLDLDFEKAKKSFVKAGFTKFTEFYSKAHANHFFYSFETGQVSEQDFIEEIKKYSDRKINTDKLTNAWNDIIVDFPKSKIELIKDLQSNYNLFLLSNTNSIHAKKYEMLFQVKSGLKMSDCFKGVYYSHVIKYRKPSKAAFEYVLDKNKLDVQKTLFIDDLNENLIPANELGMNTFLYESEKDFFHLFYHNDNN